MAIDAISMGNESGIGADPEFLPDDWGIHMLDEPAASRLVSRRVCDACIALVQAPCHVMSRLTPPLTPAADERRNVVSPEPVHSCGPGLTSRLQVT